MSNLETVNHHHKVLKLEPLELWYHCYLVLVIGSVVLPHLLVIPIILLFIFLVKLWIIFLSMVETMVIVDGG